MFGRKEVERMLIATLPPVHQKALLERILSHSLIPAVRYNTGIDSAYPPEETLGKALELARANSKALYVDLKGRQLRIKEWATMPYGPAVLNHRVKVSLPAKVCFRGDDTCDLSEVVDGNRIYVDPLPRFPVGRGQSVNILAERMEIEENLTENDLAYIKAAVRLGIETFMLSFVESMEYVNEFESAVQDAGGSISELVLKIESAPGVRFVRDTKRRNLSNYRLMAARDDLMLQIGVLNMLPALKSIIEKDASAICASRLMMGLEQNGMVSMADVSDLVLMERLGFRQFMLSDGISQKHFDQAVKFWEAYTRE